MELMDEAGEDELGVGSTVSFNVHQAPQVARLAPPFRIHCVYTGVEPESRLREVVTGDLTGVLETLFRKDPTEEGTRVTFNWYVRVTASFLRGARSMVSTSESNGAATIANREGVPLRHFGQGLHSEHTPSKRLG